MIHPAIQVAVGGGIGAVARYGVNVAALRVFGSGFPMATLLVNVIGSFVMGVLVTVLADRGANHLAPLLMTGVLGGFTTFSAFSLDTVSLWTRGAHGIAAVYVVASVALSVSALVAGIAAARAVA